MEPLDDDLREIVEQNLGLVYMLASRKRGSSLSRDDLVQAGTLGLMRAVHEFDPEMGLWSPYAYRWVSQAMSQAERDDAVIRVSEHAQRKRRDDPDSDTGAMAELVARMGVIREDMDGREEEPEADRRDSAEWVRRAIAKLGEVEQDLIFSRYWDGDKLKAMARRHGFSTSRADQRLDHAIEELRYILEPEYAKGA